MIKRFGVTTFILIALLALDPTYNTLLSLKLKFPNM